MNPIRLSKRSLEKGDIFAIYAWDLQAACSPSEVFST